MVSKVETKETETLTQLLTDYLDVCNAGLGAEPACISIQTNDFRARQNLRWTPDPDGNLRPRQA